MRPGDVGWADPRRVGSETEELTPGRRRKKRFSRHRHRRCGGVCRLRDALGHCFTAQPPVRKARDIPLPPTETQHRNRGYASNAVRNQKYTLLTFLPLTLYEQVGYPLHFGSCPRLSQFRYFFNLYFLLVALSQLVPALRIGYLFTYFGPLAFVLTITLGKEALDDWKRHKRDIESNSQLYDRLMPRGPSAPGVSQVQRIASADIAVGDLILLRKDQRVPADMVLLRTTEKTGASYVRTDQLDGETDWKLRLAVPSCQRLDSDEALLSVQATVHADSPHKDIYTFVGTYQRTAHDQDTPAEPLTVDNTLWANTVLASGNVVGLVIYTGADTRAVMNTSHPATKVGMFDLEMNRFAKILFVFTLSLSFLLVALKGLQGLWFIYLFRFLILFSSIIPISLRVNLDMGKTVCCWQIMKDDKIAGTVVRSSTIPEDLGRIEYLMTDKTGTLTRNVMELKKLHMGTMSFGMDAMDEVRAALETVFSAGAGAKADTKAPAHKNRRDIAMRIRDIVEALALCHNVTPTSEGDSRVSYQASSPDEIALVQWTDRVGISLVHRDLSTLRLRVHGTTLEYDILHVFPFTSETKRMGIILRDHASGTITFYMKGADVTMARMVQYNDWLDEECGNMAREGLRTLVIGRRVLTADQLREFERAYADAKVDVVERAAKMQAVVARLLERDLELLGLTGVEDKLQEDIRPTLELLRNAGIKIWMLTGDKVETATSIALSTKLVSKTQTIRQIQKVEHPEEALDHLRELRGVRDCVLVIDNRTMALFDLQALSTRCWLVIESLESVPLCISYQGLPSAKVGNSLNGDKDNLGDDSYNLVWGDDGGHINVLTMYNYFFQNFTALMTPFYIKPSTIMEGYPGLQLSRVTRDGLSFAEIKIAENAR